MVAIGVGLTQNDSATKMVSALYERRERLVVIACLSVVYAAAFLIYLCRLYNLLRGAHHRTDAGLAIAPFGLALDLIGFVLFLISVLVSSIVLLTREHTPAPPLSQ